MTEETRQLHSHDSAVARVVAGFCLSGPEPREEREFPSLGSWTAIRQAGSELWLDSGDIEGNRDVWTREFSGLTTNNSLLNKEVQKGVYDHLVPEGFEVLRRADPTLSQEDMVLEFAFILNAVHARNLACAFDADVSVELHTDFAWDADASYEYGRRYHELCPEHFVVKVALTPEGLLAARRLELDGVRVNCTVGFSPRQNYLVARFAQTHFVNVFLGRINTLFEQAGYEAPRSNRVASDEPHEPGTAATLSSQQCLRELVRQKLIDRSTRQIAASMRDKAQVADLAGVDVLTMPVSAAEDFASADHLAIDDRSRRGVDEENLLESSPLPHTKVFLQVGDEAVAAAAQLLLRDPQTLDGGRLRAVLADNHLGDLFPELQREDYETIKADGKIPDCRRWEARVSERSASWDGLLTEAAIASFSADQAALDQRIRQLLE